MAFTFNGVETVGGFSFRFIQGGGPLQSIRNFENHEQGFAVNENHPCHRLMFVDDNLYLMSEHVGVPLSNITINGDEVRFHLKTDDGLVPTGAFNGGNALIMLRKKLRSDHPYLNRGGFYDWSPNYGNIRNVPNQLEQ